MSRGRCYLITVITALCVIALAAGIGNWLREQHFFAEGMLTPDRVFLEESKEAKAGRIADMGCTHFVDDLPEFFRLPQFPQDTRRMLFSPQSRNAVSDESWLCFHSWRAICRYCMRHGD